MEIDKSVKKELKREIGARMRKIRKALGYTQENMVSHFDIGRANYSRIEKGEVLPNAGVMNTLRVEFNVSLDWLITGFGKTFISPQEKKGNNEIIDFGEYAREIRELLVYMDKVPMVKHAVLGFFLEYKIKYSDSIRQTMEAQEPPAAVNAFRGVGGKSAAGAGY